MIRSCLALVLLATAISCLTFGCSSAPKPIAAKTSRTVILDAATKRTTITAKVAEALTLQLPPPRAGEHHVWRLVSHDARMLHQSTDIAAPSPESGPTVTFVSQRVVSRTLLRFLLVPKTGHRETKPIDSHDVTIAIQP